MLNIQSVNKFFVRIKEYSPFPDIEGKILYIRGISEAGIQFSFTDDCAPLAKVYQLPPDSNDNGWYDVTGMMMRANTAILPKYEKCVYVNEVAMNYRNYLDKIPQPISETQASKKLCLIGIIINRTITFSRLAYYVIDCDDQGYILAYSGFCQFHEEWETPKLQQRVLRLVGTGRKLFPAEPIVEFCNASYTEDFNLAESYASRVKETVAACSTDTEVSHDVFSSSISRLELK